MQANTVVSDRIARAARREDQQRISALTRELAFKEKALAETAALLMLQKKSAPASWIPRTAHRPGATTHREHAHRGGLCRRGAPAAGLPVPRPVAAHPAALAQRRGHHRRCRAAAGAARTPANRLEAATRAAILAVANRAEFAHPAPNPLVPALADHGLYIASASRCYRVRRAAGPLARRGQARAPTRQRPAPRQATAPNPLWSWDITYLANTLTGSFFYLYLIMDVCSRKSVGWEVFAQASAEQAAAVFTAAHRRAGVPRHAWVLPADNDSPMKGATLLATRQRLGVVPAFSRPAVSNDNPYSEALFTTLKYQPDFPAQPFDGLARARRGSRAASPGTTSTIATVR
jgi:transposase InsO family protein